MTNTPEFKFSGHPEHWLGGEPRVFAVNAEEEPLYFRDLHGARLLNVVYEGGGLGGLFDSIAEAAGIPGRRSFQVLLEDLGDLSDKEPLVVYVRHCDRLLADVGPALIHVLTFWEQFARHGAGVHSMYLVVETGPREKVNAAFYPGGKVDWLSA